MIQSNFHLHPSEPNFYPGNALRRISILNEVGSIIGIENRIDIDILNNRDPPEEIREKLQNFINEYEEREKITLISLMNSANVSTQ